MGAKPSLPKKRSTTWKQKRAQQQPTAVMGQHTCPKPNSEPFPSFQTLLKYQIVKILLSSTCHQNHLVDLILHHLFFVRPPSIRPFLPTFKKATIPGHLPLAYEAIGIIIGKHNNIYVSAHRSGQILIFDPITFQIIETLGSQGKNIDQFSYPAGLAVDSNFNLFVADSTNNRISIWTCENGHKPSWNFSHDLPRSVAVSHSGSIVIGSLYGVTLHSSEGELLATLQTWLTAVGNWGGVAWDNQDQILVANYADGEITTYNQKGERFFSFSPKTRGKIWGVCLDRDGNIAISAGRTVAFLSSHGELLHTIETGATILTGIAVDREGQVLVVDHEAIIPE